MKPLRIPPTLIPFLPVISSFIIGHGQAFSQTSPACMDCHSDSMLMMMDSQGKVRPAYIDLDIMRKSVHASLACDDCHTDAAGIPHPPVLKKVDCGSCHPDVEQEFMSGIHGKAEAAKEPDAPTCTTCHGTHDILAASDPHSKVYTLNQPATCGQCHGNKDFARRHRLPQGLPPVEFRNSVHAQALRNGIKNSPSCSTCHKAHAILPPSDAGSPVNRMNIQRTCGQCHGEIAGVYEGSIHGVALKQGLASAPTCTNCHGEHSILSPARPEASTNPTNVSQQVCQPCHASIVLNQAYGLPTTQVSSYFNSYHGLALLRGSKVAANCTSCHGVHNIYATYDPRSSVNPANLEKTCGRCHPGAQASFARIPVHERVEGRAPGAVGFIRDMYIVLIVVIISGMFIHNLIIYGSFVVGKYRRERTELAVQRFNLNMVVQHTVLFVSFLVLVVTGFALKFPEVFTVLGALGIGEHTRSILHRVAGSVLVAGGLYHVYWILFRRRGKIEFREMLPTIRDLTDFLATMRYYLRRSSWKPQFDRYSYIEKVEYWALVWGTAVMALTGFILWFPVPATNLFGAWVTPVATVIHFYEALLATLAIVVWHFFFTIFHPDEYPMSLVWISGRMTEEEVRERRPRWHGEIERQKRQEDEL